MNILKSILVVIVMAIVFGMVYLNYIIVKSMWIASKAVVAWVNAPSEVAIVLLLVLIVFFLGLIISITGAAVFLICFGLNTIKSDLK